ncbi:MAG: methyltransferase domain-containing protein [Actinobacteria bacterium]|nr:methyltransferase domain-containing protein [Actinomycetota bacterium]MBV8479677.1 methyltransferase domain-containing protein [Actinomycetota bacterium]
MSSARRAGSDLHPATHGFELAADAYERGRPDYPAAAIELLVDRLDLRPGRSVLDLAAGTGKLTRLLVASGAEVIAVEPIAEMRAKIDRARVLDGTAEAIPLPDASVDAVTVAQAFHWFRDEQALPEIHRVLRSGGGLALVWNVRDETDPLHAAASALIRPMERDVPRRHKRPWHEVLDASGLFTTSERATFEHEQLVDEDGFVERFMSISFVAAAPPDVRAHTEEELRSIARDAGEPLRLPYVTEIYLAFS